MVRVFSKKSKNSNISRTEFTGASEADRPSNKTKSSVLNKLMSANTVNLKFIGPEGFAETQSPASKTFKSNQTNYLASHNLEHQRVVIRSNSLMKTKPEGNLSGSQGYQISVPRSKNNPYRKHYSISQRIKSAQRITKS